MSGPSGAAGFKNKHLLTGEVRGFKVGLGEVCGAKLRELVLGGIAAGQFLKLNVEICAF